MSEKKELSQAALIWMAGRSPSDIEVATLLHRYGHMPGRPKLWGTFDPTLEPVSLKMDKGREADPNGSYLIYSETIHEFVGLVRRGDFFMGEPGRGGTARLVFFPAVQA